MGIRWKCTGKLCPEKGGTLYWGIIISYLLKFVSIQDYAWRVWTSNSCSVRNDNELYWVVQNSDLTFSEFIENAQESYASEKGVYYVGVLSFLICWNGLVFKIMFDEFYLQIPSQCEMTMSFIE